MKQITVMFHDQIVSEDKLLDLLDKIAADAKELGLVVHATFEDVDEIFPADQWEDENMDDDFLDEPGGANPV